MTVPRDPVRAQQSRAARWAARSWLWRQSAVKRLTHCGRVPTGQQVAIKVTAGEGGRSAGYAGLQHCGSVWACPVCSAQIVRQRSELLAEVIRRWHDRGGRAVMVTLTVRHDRQQTLAQVWDAVGKGWAAATTGAAWKDWGDRLGVPSARGGHKIHYTRVTETTVSNSNGWHVHVHALLFVQDVPGVEATVQQLAADMWRRWDRAVQRAGLSGGSYAQCEAHLITGDLDAAGAVSKYFNKATLELTGGQFKQSRAGHYAPFELLRALSDHWAGVESQHSEAELRRMLLWWQEWEQTSSGRRQIGWSHGLLDLLHIDRDEWLPTDEQIVDDNQLDGEQVLLLTGDQWRRVVARGGALSLLEAFERSQSAGVELLQLLVQEPRIE